MKDEGLFERRRINALRLVETRYKRRQVKFAAAIGKEANYVNRMLSEPKAKGHKRIGESMARHIETACNLGPGSLDVAADAVEETPSKYEPGQPSQVAQQIARDFDKLPALAQEYVAEVVSNVMSLIRRDKILSRVMFATPDPKAHDRAMQRIVEYQEKYRATRSKVTDTE